MNNKKNKTILLVVILVALSLIIYISAKADTAENKIAIRSARINKIETGTANFDESDGLNYDDPNSYSSIEGYIPGNDNNMDNRIVRSFDTITYYFDLFLRDKEGITDYDERTVDIKVIIPESISKYVSFDKNNNTNETEHTYSFNGLDTYGIYNKSITLYVLGAPNGMKINPKFLIQESTNKDENYIVNLGAISFETEKNFYEYNIDSDVKYNDSSILKNYLPSIVSSKTPTVRLNLLAQKDGGIDAQYSELSGRYLTYVLGIQMVGDNFKGIKGLASIIDNINLTLNISQDGKINYPLTESTWLRLYDNNKTSDITPIIVSQPYSSANLTSEKYVKQPGNIAMEKNSDGLYNAIISDYDYSYSKALKNADDTKIDDSQYYIGTYAFTVFSPRTTDDGKNDINASLTVTANNVLDTNGQSIAIDSVSANVVNNYYEENDYSFETGLYDSNDTKLSDNGKGSVSKGTNLIYKTEFNYKKSNSNQGLKEVIKIDSNAFKVFNAADKEVKITIEGTDNLSSDDFEIKYITGDFNNSNYQAASNTDRLKSDDKLIVENACKEVIDNFNNYNRDEIMNLYGGPCIEAKTDFEKTYDNIPDTLDSNSKNVPITKIVIQTKDGIKLPDNVKIIVDTYLTVRNVSDITKTYQVTSVASSSDYDAILEYYSPKISEDTNSITNSKNYNKTTFKGNQIISVDTDSPWGDSIKIVNFTAREKISITNTTKDGEIKTEYSTSNNEIINYNIKTTIDDNNMNVGADDVWYINNLKVYVSLPKGLQYIGDDKLGKPDIVTDGDNTLLIYTLPYTKPNMNINDINFKAKLSPKIKGKSIPLTVTSEVRVININNEEDTSYLGSLKDEFTIYVSGEESVILSQKNGVEGSIIDKNSEFSYILNLDNNTNQDISNYSIIDILPSNLDKNGSEFNGNYKVKITLPDSLSNAKVYCSTNEYAKLTDSVDNEKNNFKECKVNKEFVSATAIKIDNLSLKMDTQSEDIILTIKPENNKHSDKYVNKFIGSSKVESNKIETRVINRNISGKVFIDVNENGIKDDPDINKENILLTLYQVDEENNISEVSTTMTDKDGKYKFTNLDEGKYKVRATYDSSLYDLTLRYATNDVTVDSDGYKVGNNLIEIGNIRNFAEDEIDITSQNGIALTNGIETIKNMDIGLIDRKEFGFDIKKYITRIDLNTNNITSTYTYNNEKTVALSVKNSLRATAKVYYGIEVKNVSNIAGYLKEITESIPNGLLFNEKYDENKDWFYNNGELRNISLSEELIQPGESKYLTITLDMPRQLEAKTFVNTVSVLEVEAFNQKQYTEDKSENSNLYVEGEALTFAGINWHVINVDNSNEKDQVLTLLADSSTVNNKMSHTTSKNDIYKWSTSLINNYLNNNFSKENSLDTSVLHDNLICDDASGLQVASYGGTLKTENTCQSNIYTSSKIRLLTEKEYNDLISKNIDDLSWLYGNSDFWLENSVFVRQETNSYNQITDLTNVKNLAKYVSVDSTSIHDGYSPNDKNEWIYSNAKKEVRPVITISRRNIIPE